jgi:multiple sugar transport system substrate-binding protein
MTHLLAAAALLASTSLAGAADVNLRMAIWSANKGHLDLFNAIAADFKKTHPDVTVTFDSLAFDSYTTTLTTQIAGGNAPDLAWIFETNAPDFVASGALAPLTKALKAAPGYQLEDVSKSALALWSMGGEIYAYPFSTSPFGVFVNNDLIKAAGKPTPAELIKQGKWTWDNAIDLSAAVAAQGKAGLIVRDFDYKLWDNLATIWNGWGASPWSANGRDCTMADKPMVDAVSFIHDAIFKKKAIPAPGVNADFFAGGAAMTITQISRASLLPKQNPFSWDLVPLPAGPAGKYAVIGQAGIGVFTSSKHPALAAEFLAFMTNPENAAKLAQFFPPPRTSQLKADVLAKANPLLSIAQIDSVVIDGISTGKVKPGHTGLAEIHQAVRAGLDAVWVADANVPATLQAVCRRIQPLLAR